MNELKTIVELSHEFGTCRYVKGGGGNTSVKNDETLWVKPSGTTLGGLAAETFVAMDREKINLLYSAETPTAPAAREELVKNLMADAVENDAGRPSVEAPLHNVFSARYVVHTHPELVNGLTCSVKGASACEALFPSALWVEYIDPGYTLCMEVRQRIAAYAEANGGEPAVLILKNHGIFVAGDSADEIRRTYESIMSTLERAYADNGIPTTLVVEPREPTSDVVAKLQEIFGDDAAFVTASAPFDAPSGPLTPDHLVYARAFPFTGELTADGAEAYRTKYGFAPKVVITPDAIYGIGTSQKNADLALELTQDGAVVQKLCGAFGGVKFMTDQAREFIENWEVESYRQKQV